MFVSFVSRKIRKNRNCQIAQLEGNRKQIPCMSCKQKYPCSKNIPWTWRVNDLFIEYSGIVCGKSSKSGKRQFSIESAMNAFSNAASSTREENLIVIDLCSDDESMQTTDSTLVAANAKADYEEEVEEGPSEQKSISSDASQGPERREANNQIIQKPLFIKGDEVAAKWEEDNNNNKWYHMGRSFHMKSLIPRAGMAQNASTVSDLMMETRGALKITTSFTEKITTSLF